MLWDGQQYVMPDGRDTQWVGSYAKGGHINSASFGVIGEEGSEWVAPNWMIRQPKYANLFKYLETERVRGRAFMEGGSTGPAVLPQNSTASADLVDQLSQIETMERIEMLLIRLNESVEQWPTVLQVVNDPNATAEAIQVQNEIDADSVISRK
jgi:SLT domain-containing protein